MQIKLTNPNYCATVVEITNLVDLDNCDNVKCTHIFGNPVIVDKLTAIGDKGLYFPVECKLGTEFLAGNNLYREKSLNADKERAGYFESHGRVRCVKFRGHKSQGLFLPISCMDSIPNTPNLAMGDEFNYVGDTLVAEKHEIAVKCGARTKADKQAKVKRESRVIQNQFRFHEDTAQLYKNLHRFTWDTPITVTYKLHGTSAIFSKVLTKRRLKWYEKLAKRLGVKVVESEYGSIYASRKVIKNGYFEDADNEKQANGGYYNEDLWGEAAKLVEPLLTDGLTVYAEIVGYTKSGKAIQHGYDYGCAQNQFRIYVYRVTYTSPSGNVHEFSSRQVADWSKSVGLDSVPVLYSGSVDGYVMLPEIEWASGATMMSGLSSEFLDKPCHMCKNNVPAEGVVVRIDGLEWEAYKLKSPSFYERETKLLDKGEVDMESMEAAGDE